MGTRSSCLWLSRVGTESEWLGPQNVEANTVLRHSAFSRAESAVVPFQVREGMEGEHTPETDLTRCHHVLEEGDKFERSILRLDRGCFLALLRVDTLIADFLECTEIAFSRINLPGREYTLFQSNCLTTGFSVPWAGRGIG